MRSLVVVLFFLAVFILLQTSAAPSFPIDDLPDLAPLNVREWSHAYRSKRDWSDPMAQMTGWSMFDIESSLDSTIS
ncbi:hypothetical protein QR680_011157 [Steinernema hermaphroditum]|uniref:Uncharacterized protein n=1 Tax=Steinernema hermaphroditum TaxID=289476 RepID=A0AA39MCD2_9BILA|nr:hypothetical protein QR680_011157 [Steinernema hermaphroditum]